jgi:hypothetical protein
VLTNYCWDESQAGASKKVALQSGFPSEQVYFGIDVWAQNYSELTNPRSTYPKRGGGGTNTGIAVAKLAELGFSAGIFGPAWSFEHFPGHGRDLERVVWERQSLPSEIDCSCGNTMSRHQSTPDSAVTQHARLFPAGSEKFFYTDFSRAFAFYTDHRGHTREMRSDDALRAQPGEQSILPRHPQSYDTCGLAHILVSSTNQSKLMIIAHGDLTSNKHWLSLYKLNMSAVGGLRLTVTCRILQPIMGDLGIYLKVSSRHEPQLLPMDKLGDVQIIEAVVDTSSQPSGQIQELGVYSDQFCGSDQTIPVLEIHTMTIIPCRHDQTPATPTIYNARVEECGEGEVKHTRLYWEYADRDSTRIYGMPHSEMTGPFSYFDLEINGVPAGRWYALECILSKGVAEVLRTAEVRFKITGVSFDGQALACHTATLSTNAASAA